MSCVYHALISQRQNSQNGLTRVNRTMRRPNESKPNKRRVNKGQQNRRKKYKRVKMVSKLAQECNSRLNRGKRLARKKSKEQLQRQKKCRLNSQSQSHRLIKRNSLRHSLLHPWLWMKQENQVKQADRDEGKEEGEGAAGEQHLAPELDVDELESSPRK